MVVAQALLAGLMCALAASHTAAGETPCLGDCNGDGRVAINELILGVNIALGTVLLSDCPVFDGGGDDQVGISELITAVNNALSGCGVGPRPTASRSPTPSPSATPSRSPTPTVPSETMRIFTIDPGELLGDPSQSRSGLFNTILNRRNAALSIGPGPIPLLLGTPDASGVASLRLAEDVIIEMAVVDGSRVCVKMLAAGSEGSVDCNGGTAYDVEGSQPAGNTGSTLFAIRTGLGDPGGPGNGNLLVDQLTQPVPADDLTPCAEVNYTLPLQRYPYTTTSAIAVKGTLLRLVVPGEPFDCAAFGTPGSGGMLAGPAPTWRADVGDVAAVFRFAEPLP